MVTRYFTTIIHPETRLARSCVLCHFLGLVPRQGRRQRWRWTIRIQSSFCLCRNNGWPFHRILNLWVLKRRLRPRQFNVIMFWGWVSFVRVLLSWQPRLFKGSRRLVYHLFLCIVWGCGGASGAFRNGLLTDWVWAACYFIRVWGAVCYIFSWLALTGTDYRRIADGLGCTRVKVCFVCQKTIITSGNFVWYVSATSLVGQRALPRSSSFGPGHLLGRTLIGYSP